MPRDGGPAREALRAAALDLYEQFGYDDTTIAQIAERAGVTERTYFRHFPDKREVLFDGEAELLDRLIHAIRSAPPTVGPAAAVLGAYSAAVPLFVAGRAVATRRAKIIQTSAALRERANGKAVAVIQAVTDALKERGVGELTARLAAEVGAAVFNHAYQAWVTASTETLPTLLDRAVTALRALSW